MDLGRAGVGWRLYLLVLTFLYWEWLCFVNKPATLIAVQWRHEGRRARRWQKRWWQGWREEGRSQVIQNLPSFRTKAFYVWDHFIWTGSDIKKKRWTQVIRTENLPSFLTQSFLLDHFIWIGSDLQNNWNLNVGHGRGLVRGLLADMVGKEGVTGGTSSPPTKLVSYVSDCQTSFTTSLSWSKLVFYEKTKHPSHASHIKI